jgi:hypothetical protein
MSDEHQPLFSLGQTVITANAQSTLHPEDVLKAIQRHARGDWGDLCDEDRAENARSLVRSGRLFSVYHDRNRVKMYVITEWDRSVTTVLLPEDY